ncbi:hypothetical protein L1987_63040 [Smallanthus sonchifolius]|uniref:Uncharacterized protein n=1 Tax=Smallanthus sonchifolius TaxID=185202 RepID=A0ACB9CC95_9ASTR|nr:hypothetical protein L1987_63040 [Smallanthus sonchifolius]
MGPRVGIFDRLNRCGLGNGPNTNNVRASNILLYETAHCSKYLQSLSDRTEIRKETEDIMSHISLPEDLRQQVRRHKQNKWQLTHSEIHLIYTALITTKIENILKRDSTSYGRTGFYHANNLKAGDLCGEELFLWALDPKTPQLPFSTRTVKALTDVQVFALVVDDLLFLASQFRSFRSRHVQDTFRYHSHHWRTWAASYIQAARREHWKRKRLQDASGTSTLSLGASIYVSRFSTHFLGKLRWKHSADVSTPKLELIQKPTQPTMQQSLPLGKVFS